MKGKKELEKENRKIVSDKLRDRKKQNRQLKMIFLVMIFAIFAIFFTYYLIESTKTFEYIGLDFEKTKVGDIIFYHTKIPIKTITGDVIANYNLYLRNDPRNLKDIPIEGSVRFFNDRATYVSVNPNVGRCEDANLALVNLGNFMAGAGIEATGATTDSEVAKEKNMSWIDCRNDTDNVIVVQESTGNRIHKQTDGCFLVEFKNCTDMLKVTERFMLGILGNNRGYEL